MALDRLLDLFAHRFLCFSSISFCFSYSYARQTKLASDTTYCMLILLDCASDAFMHSTK